MSLLFHFKPISFLRRLDVLFGTCLPYFLFLSTSLRTFFKSFTSKALWLWLGATAFPKHTTSLSTQPKSSVSTPSVVSLVPPSNSYLSIATLLTSFNFQNASCSLLL